MEKQSAKELRHHMGEIPDFSILQIFSGKVSCATKHNNDIATCTRNKSKPLIYGLWGLIEETFWQEKVSFGFNSRRINRFTNGDNSPSPCK